MQGDSRLIVKPVSEEVAHKDTVLVAYQTAVQKLIKSLLNIQFKHVPRAQNKHPDALVILLKKWTLLIRQLM